MSNMVEFAKALAAEAEKRGLRIVIEPIKTTSEPTVATTNPPTETHETKPVSKPTEAVSVPKIVSQKSKESVMEEHSQVTIAQAARMLGITTQPIYDRIHRDEIPYQVNSSGVMTVSTNILNGLPNFRDWNSSPVPVQCVETGKKFASIASAARYYGTKSCIMSRAVSTGGSCRGVHFRKIEN